MRYSEEQQRETRRRILRSVGRGFRAKGFGGVGIDALAKGAKVTSGAFYGHFRSKADAFRAAVKNGMEELRHGVLAFQDRFGDGWVEAFSEFYFTDRVTCALEEGCALPSFAGDVTRSDAKTRSTFEKGYVDLVDALAKGLPADRGDAEARAIVMSAIFAGGVTLVRALRDERLRERVARALRDAVVTIARR
ncbi:MAG: TetR/AcrR family transcriptional regulator [Polyangiaceae bacterium]|nr:TetR/AcrR family transcriptional regulator [Polyangiaceae bacterium]